jgi:hypothetical protein
MYLTSLIGAMVQPTGKKPDLAPCTLGDCHPWALDSGFRAGMTGFSELAEAKV